MVALLAVRIGLFVLGMLLRGAAAVPAVFREFRRRWRAFRLERVADRLERRGDGLGDWTADQWIAALLLIVGARGRGETAAAAAPRFATALEGAAAGRGLATVSAALTGVGETLDRVREQAELGVKGELALLVVAARRLGERLPVETLGEVLLEVDEQVLADGARTRLQDRMLEVFADAAGLRLAPAEAAEAPGEATDGSGDGATIDINTADLEALEAIPHVGRERARSIVERRPWERLDQLTAIDGIGPKRLEAIRASGAVCGAGSGE
jgi:DNA uptake protein ComE-like DNA-binding protein